MTKSDWEIFKQIKIKAIEQFCALCFSEFRDVIDDESKAIHERYLLNYSLVQSRNKKMSLLFDGHSRSKAWLQLLAIRGEGLADEMLVSQLTEEFREKTNPTKHQ